MTEPEIRKASSEPNDAHHGCVAFVKCVGVTPYSPLQIRGETTPVQSQMDQGAHDKQHADEFVSLFDHPAPTVQEKQNAGERHKEEQRRRDRRDDRHREKP